MFVKFKEKVVTYLKMKQSPESIICVVLIECFKVHMIDLKWFGGETFKTFES